MMTVRRLGGSLALFIAALFAMLMPLGAAQADRFDWSATVEGRAGYGTNPYLNYDHDQGSGLVGITIAPTLSWTNSTAKTELTGSYNRDQYFRRFGHTDDYNVDLRRQQRLSTELNANADVGYFSAVSGLLSSSYYNPVVVTPGAVDELAIGTRQRRVYGDAGLDWQPTARDSFSVTGAAERDTFSRYGGDYTYVGGSASYSRAIDRRTRVGVQLTGGHVYSRDLPDSSTVQPSVTLQRTLSAHWTFNGGVGAIIEFERFNMRSRTHVSPGFNASLCGTYTRLTGCATASRVAAPSGFGGLRLQTQFGVNVTYNLTPHSRILAAATYGLSHANERVVISQVAYGNQKYAFARVDYQRDITRRLAAGVGASYQTRSGSGLPDVHALAITFNLTAKFGHTS